MIIVDDCRLVEALSERTWTAHELISAHAAMPMRGLHTHGNGINWVLPQHGAFRIFFFYQPIVVNRLGWHSDY